jgi:hypothetical protein
MVWDYGGQEAYRKRYLASETDLKGVSFAFFLIDAQDPERFDLATAYFEKILKRAEDLEESKMVICLHKSDPDILGSPELQENMTRISSVLSDIFPDGTSFLPTSIYMETNLRRAFSFGLQRSHMEDKKISGCLEKVLRKTGGLSVVLVSSQPLIIGSRALDTEYLETCEELGLILADGWNRAAPTLSELKTLIVDAHEGKVLFLPVQMSGQSAYILTYSPRLPEDSFEGWLAVCNDELMKLGIQLE